MNGTINIQPKARDLTLNLNDSCNCCCWGNRRLSTRTQVYVKEDGEVVVFDAKKAKDTREAMAKCMSNLTAIMENMKQEMESAQKGALDQLKQRVMSADESPPSPITLGDIEEVMHIRRKIKPNMRMI